MGKIFSKLTSVALAATIVSGGFGVNANASELEAGETNTDGFSAVSQPTLGDARAASWGEGILEYKDFPGFFPQAYSITKTFSGNAYRLTAQTFSDNNGLGVTNTVEAVGKDTNIIQDAGLVSKTEKTKFTGNHGIRSTSSSGWQYANTEKQY